jgi:hypothetical protein
VSDPAGTTRMRCGCGHEFDQPLTDTLAAPVCPACGHVGDREVSREYPVGVLGFPRQEEAS